MLGSVFDGEPISKQIETYDGSAWSVSQTLTFVYDGWNLLAEYETVGAAKRLLRSYAWGPSLGGGIGGLLSITTYAYSGETLTGTSSYFPFYDGNGNVMGLTDSAGAVVATYDYDPFGNLLASAGSQAALDANPFRFSTKYFDSETGLYYYGYRYYDPQTQRWLSRDPIAESGGKNVYQFVGNDPVNKIDPVGLASQSDAKRQQYLDDFARSCGFLDYAQMDAAWRISYNRATAKVTSEVAQNGAWEKAYHSDWGTAGEGAHARYTSLETRYWAERNGDRRYEPLQPSERQELERYHAYAYGGRAATSNP